MEHLKDTAAPSEGLDGSSIKPVSSLRSQFESMATSKASFAKSSQIAPRQSSPRATDMVQALEQPVSSVSVRKSLEVPTPSPTQTSPDTSDSERKAPPPAPAPRRRGASPSQPVLQRAATSAELETSSRQRAPQLNVISPRSPPKDIVIPRDTSPFHLGQRPLTPSGTRPPHSPSYSPRDFRSTSRDSSNVAHQRPTSLQALDLPSSTPMVSTNLAEVSIDPPKRNMPGKMGPPPPPPFNRASKPRIVSTTTDSAANSSARSDVPAQEVSPFNTPPSGGDDFPSPPSPPPIPQQTKPRQNQNNPPRDSYFEASSRPSIRSASHGGSNNPRTYDSRSVSQPVHASTVLSGPSLETTADHPILPPRRQDIVVNGDRAAKFQQEPLALRSSETPERSSALNQGFASLTASSKIQNTAPAPSSGISTPNTSHERPPIPERSLTNSNPPHIVDINSSDRLQPNFHASSSVQNPSPPPRTFTGNQRAASPLQRTNPNITNELQDNDGRVSDTSNFVDYPDSSQSSRRPPFLPDGPRTIATGSESKLLAVCGEHICITGVITRVWDILSGKLLLSMNHGDAVKVTSLAFKPAMKIEDEGKKLWLGTNWGDLLEVDIASKKVVASNSNAHSRREIIKIHRHAAELWTLDDDGKVFVWPSDLDFGSPNLKNGYQNPRIPRGHSSSIVVKDQLWVVLGKEIKIFRPSIEPDANIQVLQRSIGQASIGDVSSSAIIPSQPDRVYFGHVDGKVSVYSMQDYKCLGTYSISLYRVSCLVGVGDYLWAGFNTGRIFVYDSSRTPWKVKKDWQAHGTVASIVADRSSIWKLDRLQVLTLGNNSIAVWDGMIRADWLDEEMQAREHEFCTFHSLTSMVVTWNAGASRPMDLRYDQQDSNFFREAFCTQDPPDIIVFGLQELVDLEDKKLTAKSFFKSKNKDPYGQEHLSSVYRDWRDSLTSWLDESMPVSENYTLLQTASLVGLFTCIFIKASHRLRIRDVQVAEIKTGMGGLHGNKGALIIRFILDDSSICFVNCHLAAGQTQTVNRNNDIASILEAAPLLPQDSRSIYSPYVGGGDGSMIMDHEICILSGDLNYRIDTLPRDSVISAVKSNNLAKLLERDQLLLSRRRNPGFRLRAFAEAPITFAPTYKYNVGTDMYDSSEKKRAPAWCDRILYRSRGRIEQCDYRRHEVRVSDHRPVSGKFQLKIKKLQSERRDAVWQKTLKKFEQVKQGVSEDAKLDYLINVFGLSSSEAQKLLI